MWSVRKGWQPYHHPGPESHNLGTFTSWALWAPRASNVTNLPFYRTKWTAHRNEGTPTQFTIQFVPGLLPWGYGSRSVRPTIQLHVVTKIQNKWSYTSNPPVCLHGGYKYFANLLLSSEYDTVRSGRKLPTFHWNVLTFLPDQTMQH